jgi:hypothetical protein
LSVAIREHKKEDKEAESRVLFQGNKNKIIVKNKYSTDTTDRRYVIYDVDVIGDVKIRN